MAENTETNAAYQQALEAFRAATRRYRQACVDYRARRIGDAEVLAAHRAMAETIWNLDTAEARLKNAGLEPRAL